MTSDEIPTVTLALASATKRHEQADPAQDGGLLFIPDQTKPKPGYCRFSRSR